MVAPSARVAEVMFRKLAKFAQALQFDQLPRPERRRGSYSETLRYPMSFYDKMFNSHCSRRPIAMPCWWLNLGLMGESAAASEYCEGISCPGMAIDSDCDEVRIAASPAESSSLRRRILDMTGSSPVLCRFPLRSAAGSTMCDPFTALIRSASRAAVSGDRVPGSGVAPESAALSRSRSDSSSHRYCS